MAVPESEDQEVGDLGFVVTDVAEARTDAEGLAEGGPEPEGGVAGLVGLGDVGGADGLQSSVEIS